jgi:L-threonylcarbamoyladenylate synthase
VSRPLPLDPNRPDPETLTRVSRLLCEGEIVAAPSDTVYGFLALPRSLRARETLSGLKERPGPFIVLVSSWEEARSWTRNVPEDIWNRLHKVWPGPVTVILPTAEDMPGALDSAIGLRMPDSVFLRALLLEVGAALFSTSANRPGEDPPVRVEEVMKGTSDSVALVLDAGPADSKEPSTVIDMAHGTPTIVRKGRGDAGPLLDPTRSPS